METYSWCGNKVVRKCKNMANRGLDEIPFKYNTN